MYRKAAKRILAGVLAICMVGGLPDTALLAADKDSVGIQQEASAAGEKTADADAREKIPDGTEGNDIAGDFVEAGGFYDSTEKEPEDSAHAAAKKIAQRADTIAIDGAGIERPSTLPNQIADSIPAVGELVTQPLIGLVIKNTDTDTVLTQQTTVDGAGDYAVYVTNITSKRDSASFRVDGVGQYGGSFAINDVKLGQDISSYTVTLRYADYGNVTEYVYEGRPIEPTVTVTPVGSSSALTPDVDFTVSFENNENVGTNTANVNIQGIGAYAGEITGHFSIIPADIDNEDLVTVSLPSNLEVVYNKAKAQSADGITPGSQLSIVNKLTGKALSPEDYTLSYTNNQALTTSSSRARVTITGKRNYKTSTAVSKQYNIVKASLADQSGYEEEDKVIVEIDPSYDASYTGSKKEPPITVYQGNKNSGKLIQNTDYTVDYGDASHDNLSGTGVFTVTAKEDSPYKDFRTVTFTIQPYNLKNMGEEQIRQHIQAGGYAYTGTPITIENLPTSLSDTSKNVQLRQGTDYEVRYANNTSPGSASIHFIGNNVTCTGELLIDFDIYKEISSSDITVDPIASQPYTGSAIHPDVTVRDNGEKIPKGPLAEGPFYTVEYVGACTQVGSHTIKITGDGKYYRGANPKEVTFQIVKRDITSLKAEFVDPKTEHTYTGSAIKPEIRIVDKDTGDVLLSGSAVESDFNVVYGDGDGNPRDVGDYTITITPTVEALNNKYTVPGGTPGALTLQYSIVSKKLEDNDGFTVKIGGSEAYRTTYDASPKEPAVTVTDNERGEDVSPDDYTVTYENNIDVGLATVTITGKGNYVGTLKRYFAIDKKSLGSARVEVKIEPEYPYSGELAVLDVLELKIDGKPISPGKILDEFEFVTTNVDVATGCLFTIRGIKNYSGTVSSDAVEGGPVTFAITQKDIGAMDVHVEEIENQAYNDGKPVEPVPVITYNGKKLVNGTDFTLTYENNIDKSVGATEDQMPTVTIQGNGNFKGSVKKTFKICESILSANVAGLDNLSFAYTSLPIMPKPTSVTLNGVELTPCADGEENKDNGDYRIEYANNINYAPTGAPRPTVRIIGAGHYGGVIEKTFEITRVLISRRGGTLEAPLKPVVGNSPKFTGSYVMPTLTITQEGTDPSTNEKYKYVLQEGVDFSFANGCDKNKDVENSRKYNLDITAVAGGNYMMPAGIASINISTFTIKPKGLTDAEIQIEQGEIIDGELQIKIIDTKRNASNGEAVSEGGAYELTSADYRLTYKNTEAAGKASVTITGLGNYSGAKTISYVIPGTLKNATVTFEDSTSGDKTSGNYFFTGSKITPKISVVSGEKTLKSGTDYRMEVIGDNVNCGTPKLLLTGIGAFEGSTQEVPFHIVKVPLDNEKIKISMPESVNFVGELVNVWPEVTITLGKYKLVEGKDFECIHERSCWQPTPVSKRKYTVQIKAVKDGNFTDAAGSLIKTYTIGNNFDVDIVFEATGTSTFSTEYTGEAIVPKLIVTDRKNGTVLKLDSAEEPGDYDVSYDPDNINAGTVKITLFGLGGQDGHTTDYCGSKTVTFQITKKSLGAQDIVVDAVADDTYSASEICPEPAVNWTDHGELVAGVDFEYDYESNKNAGTASVVIKEVSGGNFSGSQKKQFTIHPKNIEDEDVTVEGIPDHVFTGSAIAPKLSIHWPAANGEEELKEGKEADYTVSYGGDEGNVNVGAVDVVITANNKNYTGTITTGFNIVKVKLSDIKAEYSKEEQYTGNQICPPVTMTYQSTDGETITMDGPDLWGYTITYGSNTQIGSSRGSITLTAAPNGNCEGDPVIWRFAIIKRHLDDTATIAMTGLKEAYELGPDEAACEPKPVIIFKPDADTSYTLREGLDYSIEYKNNTTVNPNASLTVTGIGNFDRTLSHTFRITKNLLEYIEGTPSIDSSRIEYDGTEHHPKVDVEFRLQLTENVDYALEWDEDCVSAGVHKVKIVGIGEYSGEVELEFTIHPRALSNVTFDIPDQVYTGSPIEPVFTGIDEGIADETLQQIAGDTYSIVSTENNTEVGRASITLRAAEDSNYTGDAVIGFNIVAADLQAAYIESTQIASPQMYTGQEIRPEFTIIDKRRNSQGTAWTDQDGEDYYKLVEDIDYTLSFQDNIYPALTPATMTVTGINHYENTLSKLFDIRADLEMADIAPIPSQPYTGQEIRPTLTVKLGDLELNEILDYTVSYDNNIDRGTKATATITAVDGSLYSGSKTVYFTISKDISGAQVRMVDTAFTYTGNAITPAVSVVFEDGALQPGTDYEVIYSDNVNVGTASAVVRGINGYDGDIKLTFEIVKRSIVRCSFGNVTDKIYSGSPTKQELVVKDGDRKLVENKDYAVAYADNGAPGTATITVSGLGNYGGTKTIHYLNHLTGMTKITAKGSASSIKLSWPAVSGAKGYAIYDAKNNQLVAKTTKLSYRHKNLNAKSTYSYRVRPYVKVGGTTYYGDFSNTAKASTSIAKPAVKLKAGRKKVKVSWKMIKGVSGYEIYRSTSKTKGYKRVKTATKRAIVNYTNKGLQPGTKYYYKVRAYKRVKGSKVYGKFSSPKSVKAK